MFFYVVNLDPDAQHSSSDGHVSVPRRGFIVFLRSLCLKAAELLKPVSVPRRGFIVFLQMSYKKFFFTLAAAFQSPEGDSLFFYRYLTSQIGHDSHLATTLTFVCAMRTSPFRARAPLALHFSQIRASPRAPKTRGMLGFLYSTITIGGPLSGLAYYL